LCGSKLAGGAFGLELLLGHALALLCLLLSHGKHLVEALIVALLRLAALPYANRAGEGLGRGGSLGAVGRADERK
jgi:hypothetical protein